MSIFLAVLAVIHLALMSGENKRSKRGDYAIAYIVTVIGLVALEIVKMG